MAAASELTDFGTMSLKSSIFNRPAGVSPIFTSINTTGRMLDAMFAAGSLVEDECLVEESIEIIILKGSESLA